MCIADDSGIEIEYLDGFPGVLTKRWHKGTDRERNLAILENETTKNIKDLSGERLDEECDFYINERRKFYSLCPDRFLFAKPSSTPMCPAGT